MKWMGCYESVTVEDHRKMNYEHPTLVQEPFPEMNLKL
jgi:hypothetical protein